MTLFIRLLNITYGAEGNVDVEVKYIWIRTALHWSKQSVFHKIQGFTKKL